MSQRRGVWRGVCWSCLLSLLVALSWGSAGFGAVLQLRADPDRLPADGTSQAVIIAEVTTASGAPVPDGTPVRFLTSLGKITSPVQTVGGLAQTSFTASRTAGTARISVIAGETRQTLELELTPLPGSTSGGARLVELTAEEVAYSGERCLFVATWKAELRLGAMTLRADGLQYEVSTNVVRAQGNVVLTSGNKEVRADALRYDLLSLSGRLIRLTGHGGERLVVEGEGLATKPDPSTEEALWDPVQTDDTRAWVKSTRALIDPGDKIILDHATFYVDEVKVLSLRRHVMAIKPTSALLGDQILGFSTTGGVSLDYPYYYRASAHHIGSLSLRRNALTGSQWQPGWAVGLKEEYTREGKLEGAFSLDDLLHPSNGVHWEHRQHFVGGLSLEADYNSLSLQTGAPSYRTTGFSAFRPVGNGTLNLSLGQNNFGESKEQFSDLSYRLNSFALGHGISGTPSLHLRRSDREISARKYVLDPETGEPLLLDTSTSGRSTTGGVDVSLAFRPRSFGPLSLSGTLSTGYTQSLAGGGGRPLFSTRWTLDRRFAKTGYVGLTANYSTGAGALQPGLLQSSQKSVSFTGRGTVKKVTLGMRLTQGLGDGGRQYGSFSASTPLPFGRDAYGTPLWTFDGYHMFSRYNSLQAASTVLSLNRAIGKYQVSLKYSPEGAGAYGANTPWISPSGFGYTYSGGRHLWVEFSAAHD